MKKHIFFLILIAGCSLQALAQDTSYARYIINKLSSPEMMGRGYSYHGDNLAAKFLRAELRRNNIQPLNGEYFMPFKMETFGMEGQCALTINGKRLKPFNQFRVAQFSKTINAEVPIVELPYNCLLDMENLQKYLKKNKIELRNAMVFINTAAYLNKDKIDSKAFSKLIKELKIRNPFGSKGIILGVDQLNIMGFSNCSFYHDYAYIEVLNSAMPKHPKLADVKINTQFYSDYTSRNVMGLVKGEVDSTIILTAHYDHLGTMGDSILFPGAHDNASGVAAVLDLMRGFAKEIPHYSIACFLFSGEEVGLKGSKYASEHFPLDASKVKCLINIDMFCGGSEGMMIVNGNDERIIPLIQRMENLNQALEITTIKKRNNAANSDHWYFSKMFPSIFIYSLGGPYGGYHDPKDVSSACGLDYYSNLLMLISTLAL